GGLSCCPRRYAFRGSITRPASSFHPAPYAHCWVCTWMSLLTCWLGFDQVGLELSVLTHWVTITNFMGLHPIPRFRAYLGATSALFGAVSRQATVLSPSPHRPRSSGCDVTLDPWAMGLPLQGVLPDTQYDSAQSPGARHP